MTTILYCDSDFERPAEEISAGKTILFPTDTVYGLGSNPRSAMGVRNCYSIKQRDAGKKLPVLVDSLRVARSLVKFNEESELLASLFWPGKLSIVLPVIDPALPIELIGRDRTLALRMPNHECALKLISSCGGSLIGTSANISGENSILDPNDPKLIQLSAMADFFLSGSCGDGLGQSSTVVDATNEDMIQIVREGAIPGKNILDYLEKMSSTDRS